MNLINPPILSTDEQAAPFWARLRWDDDDWSDATHADIAHTIEVLTDRSRGRELRVIADLLDLIDEDIYSNGRSVQFHHQPSSTARALAREIDQDQQPGEVLRSALLVATDAGDLIVGLLEVALSAKAAWESARPA